MLPNCTTIFSAMSLIEGSRMSYCRWDTSSEENRHYHDTEWGVPSHDDVRQFEHLSMEVLQCGLNWDMMIRKREIFRSCFDSFDAQAVARYGEADVARIMATPGMIRSPRKIAAIINNAGRFCDLAEARGSFSAYLWDFTDGKTILYNRHASGCIPVSNGLSEKVSADLRRHGFTFLGPVVIYSHLQSSGLICDHDERCPRYAYITQNFPCTVLRRYKEKGVRYFGD